MMIRLILLSLLLLSGVVSFLSAEEDTSISTNRNVDGVDTQRFLQITCSQTCAAIKRKKLAKCQKKFKRPKGPKTRRKRQTCLMAGVVANYNCQIGCRNVDFCTRDCILDIMKPCINRCNKFFKTTLQKLRCKRDCSKLGLQLLNC